MLASGLGLILLGGCFLIGVMMLVGPPDWTSPSTVAADLLMWVLYACTFSCFAGAAWLMVSGVRRLSAAQKS